MNQRIMQALRSSEMTAAQAFDTNFFKIVSPEKVFVVDVKGDGVVYGWAFQGKGEAGDHVLRVYGIDSNECNLRFFHAASSDSDWQLTSDEEIDRALDQMVVVMVRPVLEMDCAELGRQDFIQINCHCNRKLCEECWVEKNYWEHCGIPES